MDTDFKHFPEVEGPITRQVLEKLVPNTSIIHVASGEIDLHTLEQILDIDTKRMGKRVKGLRTPIVGLSNISINTKQDNRFTFLDPTGKPLKILRVDDDKSLWVPYDPESAKELCWNGKYNIHGITVPKVRVAEGYYELSFTTPTYLNLMLGPGEIREFTAIVLNELHPGRIRRII